MQLSREDLLDSYRRMRTIRAFEDRLHDEFALGGIPGFVHLYAGQEACAVGMCMNLTDEDMIGSTHRGHGHCIAKGCDVEAMMLEIYGKKGGLCGGKGGSMHIADLDKGMLGANGIVGGSPPLAVGAALSAKCLRNNGVAVAFLGDGASNQGTTAEALNMAVVLKVPVVFVIENNGYGEFTAASYHSAGVDLATRAAGFGLPSTKVDGKDFFAVYDAAQDAIEKARKYLQPSVLEVSVNRWHGHFTGDPQPYRSADELAAVRRQDPLLIFRKKVTEAGLLSKEQLDDIDKNASTFIDRNAKEAIAASVPDAQALLTDVYVSY